MANVGTAPWVRNTALAAVGMGLLVFLLLYLSPSHPIPDSRGAKFEGLSGQGIFWVVVLLAAGASLLSSHAKTKPFSKGVWLLALAIPLWWFVWGAGWDAVGPHIGAAPTFKPKLVVELKGACVDIAQRLPARGIIDWDTRQVVNPEAIFSDGSKLPLRGDVKDRGNIRAVCGEGVLAASW